MSSVKQVAVGIFYRENQILLGQRAPEEGRFAGYWEFPGGTVEKGESPEQALVREFKEELGVDLDQYRLIEKRNVDAPPRRYLIHFYQVCFDPIDCAQFHKVAHTEFLWLGLDEALSYKLLPANIRMIESLKEKGIDPF